MRLEVAGKGTLFAAAISLITAGSSLIATNLYAGITLLVVGLGLVTVWAFLIDKQVQEAGEKAAEKAFEKLKLELERKKARRGKPYMNLTGT